MKQVKVVKAAAGKNLRRSPAKNNRKLLESAIDLSDLDSSDSDSDSDAKTSSKGADDNDDTKVRPEEWKVFEKRIVVKPRGSARGARGGAARGGRGRGGRAVAARK